MPFDPTLTHSLSYYFYWSCMISWKVDLVGVNLVPSCFCRCDFMGRIFNYIFYFSCGKLVNDLHRSLSTCMHTLTF